MMAATTALTIFSQGQGSVPAKWLNRALQSVDNFAALRAAPGITGMTVWCQGGVSFNDGLQGTFSWVQSSTAPDNNSSVIVPTGYVQGAWILQPLATGSLGPNSVPNSALAQAPAHTLKGNLSGVTASVADNTLAAVTAALSYATTSAQGAIELATNAQAIAGTSTTLGVTPAGLAAAIAGTGLILTANYNVPGHVQIGSLIVNWGTISLGASPSTIAVVFDEPFTTNPPLYVVADYVGPDQTHPGCQSITRTGMNIVANSAQTIPGTVSYLAIGS